MTIRTRAALLAAGVGLAAGCTRGPADPQPVAVVVVDPAPPVEVTTPPAPTPASAPGAAPPAAAKPPGPSTAPPKPAPPVAPAALPFRFPDDAGGKTMAAVLAPGAAAGPVLPSVAGPKPRSSAIDRGDLPLPKVAAHVPHLPLPKAKEARPSPPPERVPADLGHGSAEDPGRARLTERPGIRGVSATPNAADLPPLARQLPDRASVDDPTAEIAAVRVVLTAFPLPFNPEWFVRFGIPNPFEFAEQVRGKTPVDGELGTAPAVVVPGRR